MLHSKLQIMGFSFLISIVVNLGLFAILFAVQLVSPIAAEVLLTTIAVLLVGKVILQGLDLLPRSKQQ